MRVRHREGWEWNAIRFYGGCYMHTGGNLEIADTRELGGEAVL